MSANEIFMKTTPTSEGRLIRRISESKHAANGTAEVDKSLFAY